MSKVQVHQFGALYQVFLSFRTDNVTVAYLHSLNSHAKASHFGQKQVVLFENFRRFMTGLKKKSRKNSKISKSKKYFEVENYFLKISKISTKITIEIINIFDFHKNSKIEKSKMLIIPIEIFVEKFPIFVSKIFPSTNFQNDVTPR